MRIVIDGDTVAYRAAFAAQRNFYTSYDSEGHPLQEFRYKKQLEESLTAGDTWKKEERLEPLSHALNNCKSILEGVVDQVKGQFGGTWEPLVFLSGTDNFRKSIGQYTKYKGHRTQAKPTYLPDLRKYMEDNWVTHEEANVEADDLMSIESVTCGYDNVVLVTTDKDLNQVPGWHLNFVKRTFTYITEEEANRFFWEQMIIGDSADNISGIKGIGPAGASDLLGSGTVGSVDGLRQRVYGAYTDKYGDTEGHDRFIETYALLRLLRSYGEIEKVRENVKQ